jgi:hypothetical protein
VVSAIEEAARFSIRLENADRAASSSSSARVRDWVDTSWMVMRSIAPRRAGDQQRQRDGRRAPRGAQARKGLAVRTACKLCHEPD